MDWIGWKLSLVLFVLRFLTTRETETDLCSWGL